MLALGCLCQGRLQPLGPHCFPFQKSSCQSLLQKRPQPGEACHSPIMFFIHQVVPGPEGHQVSIVCWRWDGHGARAAHVGVTQLVGENLQLIGRETIVIPKHVIVGRPACSLKADQRVREVNMQERSPELTCKRVLPREAALPPHRRILHRGYSGRTFSDKKVFILSYYVSL